MSVIRNSGNSDESQSVWIKVHCESAGGKKNKVHWDISYIKALRRMIIPIYKSEGSKRVN